MALLSAVRTVRVRTAGAAVYEGDIGSPHVGPGEIGWRFWGSFNDFNVTSKYESNCHSPELWKVASSYLLSDQSSNSAKSLQNLACLCLVLLWVWKSDWQTAATGLFHSCSQDQSSVNLGFALLHPRDVSPSCLNLKLANLWQLFTNSGFDFTYYHAWSILVLCCSHALRTPGSSLAEVASYCKMRESRRTARTGERPVPQRGRSGRKSPPCKIEYGDMVSTFDKPQISLSEAP